VPPALLPGEQHRCLLALLHSPGDPFTNTQTVVDVLSPGERKSTHKNLHVVQFTGTLPPAAISWSMLWLYGRHDREWLTDLILDPAGYRGQLRLVVPPGLKLPDGLDQSLVGLRKLAQPEFRTYVERHQKLDLEDVDGLRE
jgi:hypothetical protein